MIQGMKYPKIEVRLAAAFNKATNPFSIPARKPIGLIALKESLGRRAK
jgi:hypothetical protein